MSRRPDLFIIGAPKCGTTSMYEYLKGHPEVYMSPAKEPGYFAPDVRGGTDKRFRYGEDLDAYLALFAEAGEAKRLGEASTRYLYSNEAPALIHDFQPQAWIVAMLRDPVEMVYAMHHERVSQGRENLLDFASAWQAEDDRRAGRRLPPGSNELGATYRERALFGQHLRRWLELFGSQRLHVIVFEDMLADTPGVFQELLRFLQVDPEWRPASFAVHNRSNRRRGGPLRALLGNPVSRWARRQVLPRALGPASAARLVRNVRHSRLNRRSAPRPPLGPQLRQQLQAEFAPDVAVLSELLGRDLATLWWGTDEPAHRQLSAPSRTG